MNNFIPHSNNSLPLSGKVPQPVGLISVGQPVAPLSKMPGAMSVEEWNALGLGEDDTADAYFNAAKEADYCQAPCWYDAFGRAV